MCMANTCNMYTFLHVSQFPLYIFAVQKILLTPANNEQKKTVKVYRNNRKYVRFTIKTFALWNDFEIRQK